MNLSNPIRSIIPSVQGDVLGVLGRTSQPLTGRGVADLIEGRAGVARVAEVLRKLVTEGIVLAEEHPPAILYRLNREHLAAESIVSLANLRQQLIEQMHDEVNAWTVASAGVWIFGSFARGTAEAASDIDVLIVHLDNVSSGSSSWAEQVRAFTKHVTAWTGNDCRALQLSATEFIELFESGARLGEDLRSDGIALTRHRLPALTATKAPSR